ncbi:MAG TPA: SH3 domain-containing protein [Usitatibacter sp.]|jgi:hypothetical protein|nr:SH3 domain-containing protein [Usitatibacter sp.]
MTPRAFLLALLATISLGAAAQEQAFTNRATELKDRAAPEAATVRSLPDNTEVKVLQRSGGWTRVDAGGQQGWVRVFHLRFPATATADSGSGGTLSGLGSALGFGRDRSRSSTIATTGIRGLSKEDLQNAAPDAEALQRMNSFRADAPAAERFAREGKLNKVEVPEAK